MASVQAAATWAAWALARTYSSSSSSPAAAVPAATAAFPQPGPARVATRATGPAIMARSASRSAVESQTNPNTLVRRCSTATAPSTESAIPATRVSAPAAAAHPGPSVAVHPATSATQRAPRVTRSGSTPALARGAPTA